MTREEAYKYFEIEFDGECDWMPDMTELQFKTFIDKVYDSLEATIQAQEIIIKDKSAIIEAMAQHKICNGCIYKEYSPMHNNCNKAGTDDGWSCRTFYSNMPDYYEPKAQP